MAKLLNSINNAVNKRRQYKLARNEQRIRLEKERGKQSTAKYLARQLADTAKSAIIADTTRDLNRQRVSGTQTQQALNRWLSQLDGNPDKATGEEGAKQGSSTTELGG